MSSNKENAFEMLMNKAFETTAELWNDANYYERIFGNDDEITKNAYAKWHNFVRAYCILFDMKISEYIRSECRFKSDN